MRKLFVILGLLFAVGARGQIYLNSYAFGAAPAAGLLLDDYPNAAAAYSLRHLRSLYTGNCIEVRKASDNTLQDIGFSGGVLDTAALKTFCAGTDCFVRTWYDQTGNAQHGQMTINTLQPRIVVSGVILRENGNPAISLTGVDTRLDVPDATYLNNQSHFFVTAVVKPNDVGASGRVSTIFASYTSGGYKVGFTWGFVTTSRYGVGGRRNSGDSYLQATSTTNAPLSQRIITGHTNYSAGTADLWENGVNTATNNSFHIGTMDNTSSSTPDNIGGASSSQDFNGQIQELVIYNSNQASNRTGMETNIRAFYNTY